MKRIEQQIEDEFVEKSRTYGVRAIKFIDPSNTGAPDRLIFCPNGRTLLIEFKKPGGKVAEKQIEYHRWLDSLGFQVEIHDSVDEAIQSLERFLDGDSN